MNRLGEIKNDRCSLAANLVRPARRASTVERAPGTPAATSSALVAASACARCCAAWQTRSHSRLTLCCTSFGLCGLLARVDVPAPPSAPPAVRLTADTDHEMLLPVAAPILPWSSCRPASSLSPVSTSRSPDTILLGLEVSVASRRASTLREMLQEK